METITLRAYAKINLGLDVLRRREDGYHEVKMILQNVGLYDTLKLRRCSRPGIHLTVEGAELPADDDNLIVRAARLMAGEYGVEEGMEIALTKRIPIAAGMAGGSVDAAAALWGMNRLFERNVPEEELKRLGVKLGADVPFCIRGGTALAEGIGEKLTALPPPPDCFLVIAKPGIGVSSGYVYQNLHVHRLTCHPDIDGMTEAIRSRDLEGICRRLGNVLETVTERQYPVITELKKILLDNGAAGALMSGSGPTVFGMFLRQEEAERALQSVEGSGLAESVFLTGFANAAVLEEEEAILRQVRIDGGK